MNPIYIEVNKKKNKKKNEGQKAEEG
jgi:hypothetical protein